MSSEKQRTAWEKQMLVREKNRPTIHDYLPRIFEEFFELHGDRGYGDDGAILGGIARLNGVPVTIIAEVKGRNLEENKRSNFAMPHPEGYRKALRLAKQAEKFHRPIICFIDTPGAFCGVEAEERGQGEAIAKNLAEFMSLKTPVVSVVLGEGGSGGALALGTTKKKKKKKKQWAYAMTSLCSITLCIPPSRPVVQPRFSGKMPLGNRKPAKLCGLPHKICWNLAWQMPSSQSQKMVLRAIKIKCRKI